MPMAYASSEVRQQRSPQIAVCRRKSGDARHALYQWLPDRAVQLLDAWRRRGSLLVLESAGRRAKPREGFFGIRLPALDHQHPSHFRNVIPAQRRESKVDVPFFVCARFAAGPSRFCRLTVSRLVVNARGRRRT